MEIRDAYGLPVEKLEELASEIKNFGSRPSSLTRLPSFLLDHPVVVSFALAPDLIARAYAVLEVLDEAIRHLGDPEINPRAEAARHLFGLTPDTRGRLLRDRRRLAADALSLATRSFAKDHERDIVLDVGAALHMTLLRRSTGVA